MAPVTEIRNVGPAVAEAMARAGITSAEALRDLGADAAYARLLSTGTRPHFIGYYSLVMGLQGRPWNDTNGPEKAELRTRFDALVAAQSARPPDPDQMPVDLANALDAMGVRPRSSK